MDEAEQLLGFYTYCCVLDECNIVVFPHYIGPYQKILLMLQIGECVARWWRPNFKTYMYSYCPPHITKSKECRVLYMVHLSDRGYFEVPGDLALLAVPMFQLCDNVQKYGPVISRIPEQISRFEFRMNN
ncbi:pre-mRNA cleavage factor Im 25 kDa subunit 2-like [Arachis stenosperma]|uniref:pre-mRNA cleavage factor Im 25 kDa subunit 2-like n=1 Tax=Arachis stenosperma TaxID=217475 RepID=UPI0025ABD143|nr:pre-mRNA cleavage factor Im 25 kDa subunit 2-like [Arachis stenosperma]